MTWTYIISDRQFLREGFISSVPVMPVLPVIKIRTVINVLKIRDHYLRVHTALVRLIFLLPQGLSHCRYCRTPIIICAGGKRL